MISRFRWFILLAACWACLSCGDDSPPDTPAQHQQEVPQEEQPVIAPEDKIKGELIQILEAYYSDLAAEQIDANTYFAPVVEQFFGAASVPVDQIQTSLDNGFKQVDDRSVGLNKESMEVSQSGDRWVATFSGTVAYVRTSSGEQVEDEFANRLTFDSGLKILRYEDANAPIVSERAVTSRSADPVGDLAALVLQSFRTANFEALAPYIHPEKGFFVVTTPGAISVPYFVRTTQEMLQKVPYLDQGMPQLKARPERAALPDFNCGDFFSKQGCFIGPPEDFNLMSSVMGSVNTVEPGMFKAADIARAEDLEGFASQQIVDTYGEAGFYLGEIEGKWYLLVIDLATYDCSA